MFYCWHYLFYLKICKRKKKTYTAPDLEGTFLTGYDGGSLSYSTDGIAKISANMRMDRCILVY